MDSSLIWFADAGLHLGSRMAWSSQSLQEKGPTSPRGPSHSLWLRLLVRCAVSASAGAAAGAVGAAALHVGQQRRLRAHYLGERAPGADFIAPDRHARRRAAHADGADQLIAVDDDRKAAGIGEIAELNLTDFRSEERRVGKECRFPWSPHH